MMSVQAVSSAVSIIIPCGPGERDWAPLLTSLSTAADSPFEIIISATEPCPHKALDSRVRWLHGSPGRAAQLNRGIQASTGEWLWLLHADSRPDKGNLAAALKFAAAGECEIGWFDLAFDDDGPKATRFNALGANLRSRWLGLPFGDQGWLMPRALFEKVGDFDPAFGRGEDLDFVIRAWARGFRPRPLGSALVTSARRYREHGWLRTSLAHSWLTLGLWLRARKGLKKESK